MNYLFLNECIYSLHDFKRLVWCLVLLCSIIATYFYLKSTLDEYLNAPLRWVLQTPSLQLNSNLTKSKLSRKSFIPGCL